MAVMSGGGATSAVGGSYVLRATGRRYAWEGVQPLSIKAFFGGQALYRAGGGYHAVGGGAYLLLNAGQLYRITIESDRPVESFCVFFAPELVTEVWRSVERDGAALLDQADQFESAEAQVTFYERLYPAEQHVWPALLRLREDMQVCVAGLEPLELNERLRDLLAQLLFAHAAARVEAEALPAARRSTRDELYRRAHLARDYAAALYRQPLTLEELGRIAFMSPNHLLRTFRAAFHETPHQYLTRVRMERAAALLAGTRQSVTEVCAAVGFASLGSFSARFKRHTGLAPQEYRRRAIG
jgi:AraC-like DNA-binding protein